MLAVARITQEILEGGEEKGAKLSFLPVGALVDLMFEEVGEKTCVRS